VKGCVMAVGGWTPLSNGYLRITTCCKLTAGLVIIRACL